MHRVLSDNRNNRLTIVLSARLDEDDAARVVATILREASKLRPGFDVLTDLRHFRSGEPSSGPMLAKAMAFLQSLGVGRVVRVIGQSREGLLLFAQFSRGTENYPVHYCPTLEEGEAYLSSPQSPPKAQAAAPAPRPPLSASSSRA